MYSSYADPEKLFAAIGPIVVIAVAIFLLIVLLAVFVVTAVVYCKIFHKAGYHWALGLLMLVPIACLIMPFVLAFGHWPILKELEKLRKQQEGTVS
jgi:uncharacterized membrane protein YhaH (DUF805 family)